MNSLSIGVIGSSLKENEKRVPIHPEQIDWINVSTRKKLFFEEGYGKPFQIQDEHIADLCGGILSRHEVFEKCDVIVIPKPVEADLPYIKPGKTLWGWLHCVEETWITQAAIDLNLTMIAWESMHKWNRKGEFQYHVFHKNNEIAGYAGVLDALRLRGIDGHYGVNQRVMIVGSGSVSRGALQALKGLGYKDIHIYTRPSHTFIAPQTYDTTYHQLGFDQNGELIAIHTDRSRNPLIDEIAQADIIVNGIRQDLINPIMFMKMEEINRLKRGVLIIDIARDEGMGFPFSRPTSFQEPILPIAEAWYYAVDHTSSYLWNNASWEISKSLLPYLPTITKGKSSWDKDDTIQRAIHIRDGHICNERILRFQNRSADYPHKILKNPE
ncbi:MAG: alanine dehydrogenase [Anaerolineaceae bacterium]|nr:alanine dehydrogenase [Anaerolineaceae bacterium]